MGSKTTKTLIHIFGMIGVNLLFIIFFQQEWVPQWIQQNIQYVPMGQMLAYGGYFGACLFILTNRILIKNPVKLYRTKENVVKVVGKVFHDYATMFLDLVTITVIVYTFFAVGYGIDDPILFWSAFCSLVIFPYLGFFSYWIFHKQKLDYVMPIFPNSK